MPWYAPWSESIKKRACRYLLQRYLGCFLEEKLTLDQLSVDLYRGTGTVSDLTLDTEAINELGDAQNWPLLIVDGYMREISVTIPWSTLLKEDSVVEVHGLSVTLQPKMRSEPGSSMLESMWSSMSSSMQLAAECLQAETVPDAQPVEGIEMFAHAIDSILSRVKVKFINTKIRIEHVPKSSDTGIALELHIRNIDYWDEAGSEPTPDLIDSEQNKTYVVSTFTSKRIAFEGVTFFTDEYPSVARTVSRVLVMERSLMTQSVKTKPPDDVNIESVLSDVFYESRSTFDPNKSRESSEGVDPPSESDNPPRAQACPGERSAPSEPVLFAKLTGRQELSLKIKQSDEASGPKVDLQLTLGSLILFLSPRQLHILLELINGLCSPHLEDTSNMPLRSGGASECKPMRAADFQRVEAQLLGTLAPTRSHHVNARGWSGQSFEESDTEGDRFLPLGGGAGGGGGGMTDSCTSSVSSMSASVTSEASGLYERPRARVKRNRKVPQIDGDPTAEVSHVNIRVASCSCILLHKDILVPTSVGAECVLPASVKKMNSTACEFFERLGFFAVSGYGSKDFDVANQTFDKATSLSHLRLISTSLTLDGSEKTTSQGCQTVGHVTVTRLHLRECLGRAAGGGAGLDGFNLIYFDRPMAESSADEAFVNPLAGPPDVKLIFKQTQKAMRISGEKKLVYPTTDITVTYSPCTVTVDVTLLDRLAAALHGGGPCPAPHAPPAPPAPPAQHQRSLALVCSHLTLLLRFPVVDLRPSASREERCVRADYLRLSLAAAEVTSLHAPALRRPAPTVVRLRSDTVHIHYHENESDPGIHIAHASAADAVDPNILTGTESGLPTVSLTFLPTKSNKGPFESSSDEEPGYEHSSSGNPMTHSVHLMDKLRDNSNPSPFSSKKMVHQSDTAHDKEGQGDVEELVVPGNAEEMAEFTQHATAHAAIHLECCFPTLSLQLQSKQLYEVLYNRINSDLMLWEPWVPQQHSVFPLHASIQPLLQPQTNVAAFAACRSALSPESESASSSSEEDNVYYSTYDGAAKQRRLAARVDAAGKGPHDFCLTLKVDRGQLTMYTPVRDGNSRVVPEQAGEICIVASRLSMCQVAGVRGRPKHALMCLRAHTATLFHAPLVPSSWDRSSLPVYGAAPAPHLLETISPSGAGVSLRDTAVGDLLTLAVGVEPHRDLPNFKKIRAALGIERASLRHRGEHGTEWLSQLLHQLDVLDYPVAGYQPCTVLTELHVHLWDCAVDYRPLYLPIRSVITLGSFSVSSNVIANTNTSNLRFIAQECALFLAQAPAAGARPARPAQLDDGTPPDLRAHYVCVLELGLFELSLRMTDKNHTSGPQVELRASNNVVHARTCWDSASALGRLITYVAASGDTQPPEADTPHTSLCSERADSLLQGLDEKQPDEIRELSPSEVQQVHDLMAEAMKESPNSTAGEEEITNSGEKEGVEVFFFPDESKPKGAKEPASEEELESAAESREGSLEPTQEGHFQLDAAEAPPMAQVARELGDPTAKAEKKPDRPARTSDGGNTDDEFCVLEGCGAGDEDELAEPTVRWLCAEPLRMLDNHFTVPLAKTDVLRPPNNFPTPVLRYTLCEMSIIWHMYGGNDFKLPSDETTPPKKHVTINETNLSPTSERRGATYEPYETTRQTAAAYLQRGVAWGRASGLRPGGTAPAPRGAAWRHRGGPQRDLHTHVEIQLNKVKFQHESYGEGLAQAARQTLAVGKLEVRDRLAASNINKFLSHHVSKEEPERRHAHMLVVKAVHLRPEPALPAQECCLKVSLLPLRFHIDQDTLLFLVHFFSKLGADSDSAAGAESDERSVSCSSDAGSPKATPTHRPPVMSVATHLRDPPPPTPAPSPDTLSLSDQPLGECGQLLLEAYEAERLVSDNLIQLEEEWRMGAAGGGVGAGAGRSRRASSASVAAPTSTTSSASAADTSPLYFRRVVFAPDVPIRLDYVGKRVDLSAGPVAGLLMGLGQLNCSELRLKRLYHRHGILGVERLVRWALQEWLADIKRNQLPGLLSGIGPMHSLLQLLTGIRDLLWLPVEQWRRDGRLVHGLRRGAASFTARTAVAALDITARILHIIQATAETALDMLTPGPTLQLQGAYEQRRRRRRRRNDPSRQPTDIREGVANAVQIVREGIAETAETMSLAARSERGVGSVLRHLPGAAVAPLALAAAGAADVLGGVRSQLVPHHRRHHTDKWRPHHADVAPAPPQ